MKTTNQHSNRKDDETWKLFELAVAESIKQYYGGNPKINVQYHYRNIFTKEIVAKYQVDIELYKIIDTNKLDLCTFRVIECKYKSNGNSGTASDVLGLANKKSKRHKNRYVIPADEYMIATVNRFSDEAKEIAEKHKIKLIEGPDIIHMYNNRWLGKAKSIDDIMQKQDLTKYPEATIKTKYVLI